jgi:hypothetical protein
MRDQVFENKLIAFCRNLNQSIKKIGSPTDVQIVVCALAQKCMSHCEMALELIAAGAKPEAVILLRAAYEAIVRAMYLDENPSKVMNYKAFGAITTLRNQLELLKLLREFGEPAEILREQEQLVVRQRQKIIAERFHDLYGVSEADLGTWAGVKKLTNKSNFQFEDIRKGLAETALTKALFTTGFQVYNLGSQMTHSNFDMLYSVAFEQPYPLYTEHAMYRQVLLLLRCGCHCYRSSGAITDETFDSLEHEARLIANASLLVV